MRGDMDDRVLRELLRTWQLPELYEHFRDEGIGVEELKLMKQHHVAELLQHFRLGVRVRFEHHFDHWRQNLFRPIVNLALPQQNDCCRRCWNNSNCASNNCRLQWPTVNRQAHKPHLEPMQSFRSLTPSPETLGANGVRDITFATSPPSSPIAGPSPTQPPVPAMLLAPVSTLAAELQMASPAKMPKLTPQPKRIGGLVASTTTAASEAADKTSDRSSPSPAPALPAPAYPGLRQPTPTAGIPLGSGDQAPINKNFIDQLLPHSLFTNFDHPPLSLMQILQASGVKGNSLIDHYREHHEFTNTHRLLLISLIVNFFDDNDFHLSLNMSHHLENQILRLFPSETLSDYRTEKRGKIYVKFCNMKRYRKGRPLFKRNWNKDISIMPLLRRGPTAGSREEDESSLSYENWEQPPNIDMQIKTEDLSEDDGLS